MRFNRRSLFGAFFIAGICFALMAFLQSVFRSHVIQQDILASKHQLDQAASSLTQSMSERLALTQSLTAFVHSQPEFSSIEFDRFASYLKKDITGIRSLQLAPDGVVMFLTNFEENKRAMGFNLFHSRSHRLIEAAIDQRSNIIEGPIDLVQGGWAIVAREPIFAVNAITGDERFWGFSTVLIELSDLLAESGFNALEEQLEIGLRGKNATGEKGEIFYGAHVFENPLVSATVRLPTGSWHIVAQFKEGYQPESGMLSAYYWLVSVVITLLIGVLSYLILNKPNVVKEQVKRATKRLSETLDSIDDGVITLDEQGVIERMNRVAENMTGYQTSAVQGQSLDSILNMVETSTSSSLLERVDEVLEKGHSLNFAGTRVLISRVGQESLVTPSIYAIKDSKERIRGVVLVLKDMAQP